MGGRFVLLLGLVAYACGETPADSSVEESDADVVDAAIDVVDARADECGTLGIQPDWLAPQLEDTVARLTGEREIATGVLLTERIMDMSRARTQIYLEQTLRSYGFTVFRQGFGLGANVIGRLDGRTDQTVVLGAHYDTSHFNPLGANDNATGVASVLASAHFLALRAGCLRHNVEIVFFDGDNAGALGLRPYAKNLLSSGRDVLGVYLVEQIGWDMDGDRRVEAHLPSLGLVDQVNQAGSAHGLGAEVVATERTGHNHQVFRALGFSAAIFTEEIVDGDSFWLSPFLEDTFGTVDLDYLSSTTTLFLAWFSEILVDPPLDGSGS